MRYVRCVTCELCCEMCICDVCGGAMCEMCVGVAVCVRCGWDKCDTCVEYIETPSWYMSRQLNQLSLHMLHYCSVLSLNNAFVLRICD